MKKTIFVISIFFLFSFYKLFSAEIPLGSYESEYSFALKSKNGFIGIFRGFLFENEKDLVTFRNFSDDARLFPSTCNYKFESKKLIFSCSWTAGEIPIDGIFQTNYEFYDSVLKINDANNKLVFLEFKK